MTETRQTRARSGLLILFFLPGAVLAAQAVDCGIHRDKFIPPGQYYQATVPDTLDLAERARLAVRGLTNSLNPRSTEPAATYAPFGLGYFSATTPYLASMPRGTPNWGKWAEGLILNRAMCGSRENLEIQEKFLQGLI